MGDPVLNRSVVLEAPQKIADGAGGYVRNWEPLGVLWAEVKAGTGRETSRGQATLSRTPFKVTVRAAPYGAPSRPCVGQRLVEGSRIYNIFAVAEVGAHAQYIVCHADEEVAP